MLIFFGFLAPIFSLKPIFYISGFGNSPVYATITQPELYPECPANVTHTLIYSAKQSTTFPSKYPDCAAKLLRVQLNKETGQVEQLPGMDTHSSPIGESSLLVAFDDIVAKAKSLGYVENDNLFGVGYNFFLHPVTSNKVFDNLKQKIEEVYKAKNEKAVLMAFSLGTNFVSLFLSNYSQPEWVTKYIDSIVLLAPAIAGFPNFQQLYLQQLTGFTTNDELKKSIMRMPGLHIMLPNYVAFGNKTIIYNMYADYNVHDASHTMEFLKFLGKVDDDAMEIFQAHVEKYLKAPLAQPLVPSYVLYNDYLTTNAYYVKYNHQQSRVVSLSDTGDGTVTPMGPEHICSQWTNSKCYNSHSSDNHLALLKNADNIQRIFEFIFSDTSIPETPKKGLFLASGFQGSPIYGTVLDKEKASMCPENMKYHQFFPISNDRKKIIDDKDFSLWLSDECLAMLTRVELDPSGKFVTYAPGLYLQSSPFNEYKQLLSYDAIIPEAFKRNYTILKNLYTVGYNFMLHPLMSDQVYGQLKESIEKYYNRTGMKSVIGGHSQGTSFVYIFINYFVTREWAQKYVDGVIFYAPAFSGWGTYGRSVSGKYGSGFPDSLPSMQISTMRMPGCHIMMPNEAVYGNETVIKDFPEVGQEANASHTADLLKKLNRMDDTAYKIFQLTDKYRKYEFPEPPVPSLVIYNSYVNTGNGYAYHPEANIVTDFFSGGDGTVAANGPNYACKHWKNVQCYDYNRAGINHANIQTQAQTLNLTFSFIEQNKPYIDPTSHKLSKDITSSSISNDKIFTIVMAVMISLAAASVIVFICVFIFYKKPSEKKEENINPAPLV